MCSARIIAGTGLSPRRSDRMDWCSAFQAVVRMFSIVSSSARVISMASVFAGVGVVVSSCGLVRE
ncbi:hypothetical protein [Amycolatopsis sp. NPDC059657]|uniref:hypothetical protein n=1 Tax=Amycolatopsis sp. NPDC059657 TaxID=3346899 RepID=UPI00366F8853